jgi:peptidyl-prolyl cis-trans isomerase SurA
MRPGRPLALALILAACALAQPAHAVIVEKVVAVVGEKAILLTDLHRRARPALTLLYAQVPQGPERAAAESKVLGQIVEKMVEEELASVAADKGSLHVTSEEVDKALRAIARAANMTLSQLFEDVQRGTGMSEVEYREEIRRQVLEGKLLGRYVQNQRLTDKELEEMFERVRKAERAVLLYNPAWIVLAVGANPTPELLAQRMAEADDIVKRLRAGADFAELAAAKSEDPATKDKGGDLGIRAVNGSPKAASGKYKTLAKQLEQMAVPLEQGEVSDPFRFQSAIVIMTIQSRQTSRYTALDAVRGEMIERVRQEKLQKIRSQWLKELRGRTHVEVRI